MTVAQWPLGDHNTASGRPPREVRPARRRPAGEGGGNAANACFTSRKRSELEAVRPVESDKIRGPSLRDRGGEQERSAAQNKYTEHTCDAAARARTRDRQPSAHDGAKNLPRKYR
jgi:hypothetical protein